MPIPESKLETRMGQADEPATCKAYQILDPLYLYLLVDMYASKTGNNRFSQGATALAHERAKRQDWVWGSHSGSHDGVS